MMDASLSKTAVPQVGAGSSTGWTRVRGELAELLDADADATPPWLAVRYIDPGTTRTGSARPSRGPNL
jgi:hypothetical protein